MLILETMAWFVILSSLVVPAVPWVYARKHGGQGVWSSTSIAVLVLGLLHVSLFPACVAAKCGQGAIILPFIWGVGAVSAVATLISAGAAAYFWRQ